MAEELDRWGLREWLEWRGGLDEALLWEVGWEEVEMEL